MTRKTDTAGGLPGLARQQTCEQWMPLLLPHLPDELATQQARQRLLDFSRVVPANLLVAWEFRLGKEHGPVDFSFCVTEPELARQLAEQMAAPHQRETLQRFADQPDERMPYLWFEYDLDQPREDLSQPVFIIKLLGDHDPAWLMETAFPAIHGQPLVGKQRDKVTQCLEALRPPARLVHLFDLGTRGQQAIRLDYMGVPPREMVAHLERVDRPDLARAISGPVRWVEHADRFHFNYDVAEDLQPRLGIEANFEGWSGKDPRWRELLDRLVTEGLCTPAKRDAVLAWPGYDSARRAPDLWPTEKAGSEGYLVRFFSHLKLVCHRDHPPEAKMYFLFGYYLRNAEGRLTHLGPNRR